MKRSNEIIQQLCSEVATRIAKYHQNPASIYITLDEMTHLNTLYPTLVVLEGMRRTAHAIKRDNTMTRERMLKAVYNLSERVLEQSHANGKLLEFRGNVQPTHIAAPTPVPATNTDSETILDIRAEFQDQATHQDWTITTEQAMEYLKQAGSAEVMQEAMRKLGKYSAEDFEAALSDLTAAIAQILWMREMMVSQ